MSLSKAYSRQNDERPNLGATALSRIPKKLEPALLSQSLEDTQIVSMGQEVDDVRVVDVESIIGRRGYRSKISSHSHQRVKASIDKFNNYDDLLSKPRQSYSPFHKTYKRISELGADNKTYKYTIEWLNQLRAFVAANRMWWCEPLVNLSFDSEIVFEWWYENKKLTVYILGNTAEYIKVWGTDIDNEMEDGLATSAAELMNLWKWLVS